MEEKVKNLFHSGKVFTDISHFSIAKSWLMLLGEIKGSILLREVRCAFSYQEFISKDFIFFQIINVQGELK